MRKRKRELEEAQRQSEAALRDAAQRQLPAVLKMVGHLPEVEALELLRRWRELLKVAFGCREDTKVLRWLARGCTEDTDESERLYLKIQVIEAAMVEVAANEVSVSELVD